jgi:hypothetical protein
MGARRAQLATKGRNSRREQRPIANRFTRPNRGRGRSLRSPAPGQEAAMTQPVYSIQPFPPVPSSPGPDGRNSPGSRFPNPNESLTPRKIPGFPYEALEQYHRM